MEHLKWCNNLLQTKEAQQLLEEKVETLIMTFFKGKSDYAIEKFIKSFSEGISYLENSLQKARGIHPSQIQENMMYISTHPEETAKKIEEVKMTLLTEINRQYRHFNTFLLELA